MEPSQQPQLSLLTLISLLLTTHLTASPSPFPKDLQPISIVGQERSSLYPGFQGLSNDDGSGRLGLDFQRMLRINHMLYIAARDHVFVVNLTSATERIVPKQILTWRTKDVEKCTVRGKNSDECYNYIKVLIPRNDETLFACGTNAFNPTCRNYKMNTLEQVGEDVVGQARCPFESRQSNVALFAGGSFYSATMADFLASDAVIYRSLGGEGSPVLRTVKYDSKWLREPHFVHAIEYGNYVYFFLSEIAVEYTSLGKVVYSRVARVCKNDNGGSPRVLERYWTSFLKARLNCTVPGDSFFYFDVLQSVSSVLQINRRPAVIAVFTTQANSIPGSAVCAFYMDDIEKTFNGKFKEQKNSDSTWTPVPEEQVPKPRPGSCAGDDGLASTHTSSTSFPDNMLTFIKSYPLMDEAVPSVNDQPLFIRTASRYRLNQMAVDTSAGPYKNHTVLFLGSEDGHILKVLASTNPESTISSQLLEDIDVYNPFICGQQEEDRRVLGLEMDKEHHALYVAFTSCVIRLPLSRCTDHGNCKKSCLSSRDPYCIWIRTGSCAHMAPGFKAGFEQDIGGNYTNSPDNCHHLLSTTRNQNYASDSAYGVKSSADAENSSNSVHYTLLIACVLVAFVMGAFLSAFLVSCYFNNSSHRAQQPGKESEGPMAHALSLHSLAKLNSLLERQPKNGKKSTSSPKLYSSFITHEEQRPSGSQSTLGEDSRDLSLQQAEDLSGLPTPDTTPELPIKNMAALSSHWDHGQSFGKARDPGVSELNDGITTSNHGVSQQSFAFGPAAPNGQAAGVSEGRMVSNSKQSVAAVTPVSLLVRPYPRSPQAVDAAVLDDLLKHIREGGDGRASSRAPGQGLTVLTSSLLPGPGAATFSGVVLPQRSHSQKPTSCYASSAQSARQHSDEALKASDQNAQSPSERPAARHPAPVRSLIKMGSGGKAMPRHHSFNQRLVHVNSTGYECSDTQQLFILSAGGSACLTRQHSYSEPPHAHRGAVVRRAASLKPQVPPKPLLPLNQQDRFS
ncbi:semaphorin-6D-like [Denticeps clupeoides]|uniref:Semaphorin-2A n=1 Tax=Denticeps clupeoides TaxID=299321 RepID=A0AAY4EX85_9TELE|nr:semaphorin-6D-like [Denticeps clupeoides]XP_028820404.1 semaphorin-6D-like [Denticeps clupeoides]XP_028820405.1 semaphorin-6D-like [Denticeps clupeoides]